MGGNTSQQVPVSLSPHVCGSNRITELQFLFEDVVPKCYLVRIDSVRMAVSSKEGIIYIWDYQRASLLFTLVQPTPSIANPTISNMVVMKLRHTEHPILVSAYGDFLSFWNPISGELLGSSQDKHQSQITFLCPLQQPELFAYGGDKRFISIRNIMTHVEVTEIERRQVDAVTCMLSLPGGYLAVGTSRHVMFIYNYKKVDVRMITVHTKGIHSFADINENLFASGSLDGSVAIYNKIALNSVTLVNKPNSSTRTVGRTRPVSNSMRSLFVVGGKYLIVVMEDGFQIFRVDNSNAIAVVSCVNEKTQGLTGFIPLYNSTRFFSCSDNGIVRMWSINSRGPPSLNSAVNKKGPLTNEDMNSITSSETKMITARCQSKMQLHAGKINHIIPLSEFSFATAGEDGQVILWKDSRIEEEIRNHICSDNLP